MAVIDPPAAADEVVHLDEAALRARLPDVDASPPVQGVVAMVVVRPAEGLREVLAEGVLDLHGGLVGDDWVRRPNRTTPDRGPHPDMQVTLVNSRFARHVAGDEDRAALFGDQLHVDLSLAADTLPPGAQVRVGTAVVEVTAQPHRGCAKFSARFGRDALRFVNSPQGMARRLRGVNARVVQAGVVRPGDAVVVLAPPEPGVAPA